MNANLYAILRTGFADHLDETALETPQAAISYRALDALAGGFAVLLSEAGAAPGDRVAVQVEKSVAAVALYLGCLRAGLVFVPLNTAYTPAEVGYFLSDAKPRVFVCRPQDVDALSVAAGDAGVACVWALGPSLDTHMGAVAQARAKDAAGEITPRTGADLAAICYTSGTTGRSKGARLTHANLSSNAIALHDIWGFAPGDVLLHALPIFHVHGLFVALHTALLNASKIIFLPAFDPSQVRARLSDATVMMGVPTFYTRLLEDEGFSSAECAHMRLFISGSAPLTAQASDAWNARTGHRILERYGMTEAGMITSNPLDGERVAGTVGFALPDVALRVCDGDGVELARGEPGVLEVRGPNVCDGYWDQPDKTAEEFRADGFFITGDIAVMDDEGRISIVGRAKDLIISGGYNIYPKEIEGVLDGVPGVAESAVVGAPHTDLGEGVVAVLVADGEPVEEAVLTAALNAALARFKHPRRYVWVDALPRNAMGKVQKVELRRMCADVYSG